MASFRYDAYGRTEPSRIFIARPGKHLLGCLNGVPEESCSLTIDFINADTIEFNVYKYHDEELTAYYNYVDILMELYVDGFGWFIIDESPSIHNDGLNEYKSVTAHSYEIALKQYDLVDFDINTASATSREMLATDNVYTYEVTSEVWYNLFRDRVLFYRDSSSYKSLLDEMNSDTTFGQLQALFVKYPDVAKNDWRIGVKIDASLKTAFESMKSDAETEGEIAYWQRWIETYDNMMASTGASISSDEIKSLFTIYPTLLQYVELDIDNYKYENTDEDKYVKTTDEYTAYELMEMEYTRIKELSLLDLAISDLPGWSVGEVDSTLYDTHVDSNGNMIRLADEVGSFQIDSKDVYSFFVNELSGYFECIFQFDTINNTINAYRIESIGDDTRIFLGFRNIENSVEITPAQDLYTQFTVENSEGLGITAVNFGEREIEDISYFLNTKYLPQELINKYKKWQEYRESIRDHYIQLSKDYNSQLETVNEIKNRVPSDMLNTSQLDGYTSSEQLEEVITNYYALMIGMLNQFIYVSDSSINPPEGIETYDDINDYIADMNTYIGQLEALVDVGKEESSTSFADSLYYKDYMLMRDFTVPNLVIAYHNLELPSYETKDEYYDSYEFDFQTYGWMYGIDELKVYQKSHLDKMDVLKEYELSWDDIPDTEQGEEYKSKYDQTDYDVKHELYLKYKQGYESVTQELAVREREYKDAKAELDRLERERNFLADSAKMEKYSETLNAVALYEQPGGFFYQEDDAYLTLDEFLGETYFTDEEIERISRFYKHTDYSNDNINYLDMLDTSDSVIDKQLEMFNLATDELYAQAHPQYVYNTTLDNLLANNEYADYHPDFEVGNFVRLGLDDETQIRLRMITISFNPMMLDNNLDITFSNIIRYKSRINDFASLLDSAITSAKNSISARYNRTADKDNTVEVTYDLVQKILQSAPFTGYAQNLQASSVSAATGAFQGLTSEYLKTNELAAELANITELHADSAFMKYLEANLIVASEIKVDDLKAKLAQIDTLQADSAFVNYLQTLNAVTVSSIVDQEYVTNLIAGHISAGDLTAGDIVLTDNMRIVSDNGALIMNGTALQIQGTDSEGNPYVGIQLGYDAQSNPSLILRNEDGATILTPSGITSNAIADGLIVNNMVSNGTISKNKLAFEVIEPNEYGGVDITQVYDGSGNLWGTQYTSFKNQTEQALSDIESTKMYRVVIESDNGNIFRLSDLNCTLSCRVYSWDEDITDDINAVNFIWTRKSKDTAADTIWNTNHSGGQKTLTLTSADVWGRSVFYCTVTLPDGTEIVGS